MVRGFLHSVVILFLTAKLLLGVLIFSFFHLVHPDKIQLTHLSV